MQWFKLFASVLSPLVLALIVSIALQLRGMWFVLIVLGGLIISMLNGVLVTLRLMK